MITTNKAEKINHMSWVDRVAQFTHTELYQHYYQCLQAEREEILLRGKKSRDPHVLSMLEGFDQAASFFQRAVDQVRNANKQTIEEVEYEPGF